METTATICMLILSMLLAKKKNPVRRFGQMTLDLGGQALEYLKGDPKGVRIDTSRLEWMHKNVAVDRGWNLPPWIAPSTTAEKEQYANASRYTDVCIIHPVDEARMPMLVHQPSALRGLDELLGAAQDDGAEVTDDGKVLTLQLNDCSMMLCFIRNTKAGRFARFIVKEE